MTDQSNGWGPVENAFKGFVSGFGVWVAILFLMAATRIYAEEKKLLSFDLRTDVYSSYVWRGKVLDRHAVAQPSAIATLDAQEYGSFSMKIWSNWDLSQHDRYSKATSRGGGINVLSLTPSYTKMFGPVDLTVGNIFYTFPGNGWPKTLNSTYELFTTLAYRNSVVTPSLSVYYDYRGVGGGFLEDNPLKDLYSRAALDKSVPICNRLTASGTVLVGWATSHYNAVRNYSPGEGFVDYQGSLKLTYAVTDAISVAGTLAYTGLIGGALGIDRDAFRTDEILWGGFNLRWLF